MKVIIASRMSSSRLPGKALLPMLGDMSMLDILLHRVRLAKSISGVILATSENTSDNELELWALRNNVECFRGSLDDVLGRLVACINEYELESCVEVLGDNPMVDPGDIDRCVDEFNSGRWDYVATSTTEYEFADKSESYPIGVRVQCLRADLLIEASEKYLDPHSREHSSSFIYGLESKYKRRLMQWPHESMLSDPDLNLAVNTSTDFERNARLLEMGGLNASLPSIMRFLTSL